MRNVLLSVTPTAENLKQDDRRVGSRYMGRAGQASPGLGQKRERNGYIDGTELFFPYRFTQLT